MASPWEVVKDSLGFLGAVIMAVPWLRDYFARRRRDWLRGVPVFGSLAAAIDRRAERLKEKLGRAKDEDFVYMTIGLVLLALSFAISLWRNVIAAS